MDHRKMPQPGAEACKDLPTKDTPHCRRNEALEDMDACGAHLRRNEVLEDVEPCRATHCAGPLGHVRLVSGAPEGLGGTWTSKVGHAACQHHCCTRSQHVSEESRLAEVAQAVRRAPVAEMAQCEHPTSRHQCLPRESSWAKVTQLVSTVNVVNRTNGKTQPTYPQHLLRDLSRMLSSVWPANVARSKRPAVLPQHVLRESYMNGGNEEPSPHPKHVFKASRTIKLGNMPVTIQASSENPAASHRWRAKRPLSTSLLAMTLLLYKVCGVLAGRITVDPHVKAVWGKNVTLRCIFEVDENITQISWEKELGKMAIAVHHPDYGISVLGGYKGRAFFKSQSLHDASLVINHVEFSDSGVYICKAATFPLGNEQGTIRVAVIVEPTVSLLKGPHPLIDEGNLSIAATCTAANGKPAASVRWEGDLGQAELKTSSSLNDTVTVVSQYKVIPTRFAQGRTITCVVSHPALENDVRRSYVLDIQYAPEVSVTGYDGKWFVGSENLQLWCKADANPPPTEISWSRLDGEWPEGLLPLNTTLLFSSSLTHNHSGIYVCKVTNALGERSGQKSIHILDPPTTPTVEPTVPQPRGTVRTTATTFSKKGNFPASTMEVGDVDNLGTIIGCAVGGALLVVLVIVLAGVLYYRRRQTFRGDYFTKNYTPPSGMQKESQVDVLQTVNLDPYPDSVMKEQHPMGSVILSEPMGSSQKPHWNSVDTYNSRYQERFERPHGYYDDFKAPMTTKHSHEDGYDDNDDDFVSHVDGSVISRKEWYV